jgi:hypothetical protein
MNPDWRDYERQIHQLLFFEYPGALVIDNAKLKGQKSKALRQVDVLIQQKQGRKIITGIAECKNLTRKIDVQAVDALIGKMKDLDAAFGIIITAKGYSEQAKQYAEKSGIEIKVIPYEFLKDYGFVSSNFLAEIAEVFMQEVEYDAAYCSTCEVTNLYEIKIVRGFSDHGIVSCPKCKTQQFETRLDGNYRVIARYRETVVTQHQINKTIVDHLIWTRTSWDRRYTLEGILFQKKRPRMGKDCAICYKEFSHESFGAYSTVHKDKVICIECFMSKRTLLIDYNKI